MTDSSQKPYHMNLHGIDRNLARRAKAHAASLGLTLKDWIIRLIEKALARDGRVVPMGSAPTTPDAKPSAPAPSGRRDLLPPGGSQ